VALQSAILKCTIATAVRDDGAVTSWLQVDPNVASSDHIIASFQRSAVVIDRGKTYR
jgi:hypothetical protein